MKILVFMLELYQEVLLGTIVLQKTQTLNNFT